MNRRITIILGLGAVALSVAYFVPRHLISQNRIKSHREIVDEEARATRDAEFALMRANAKTPEEKLLISYWTRTSENGALKEARLRYRGSDGVDQFEAWLVATSYFTEIFGICGVVGLPRKEGAGWRVSASVGSPPPKPVTVFVDSTRGRVTCEGHATIVYADGFFSSQKEPNQ